MVNDSQADKDSVAVLYQGGRLPSWDLLTHDQQEAFSLEHVDLMLSVAHRHGMLRLEGFKLLQPQDRWQRFWVIEFPTLEGAEAWIDAEMAPPYGLYGYYEYNLSRPWRRDSVSGWVASPPPPVEPVTGELRQPRDLGVDMGSVVALTLDRWRAGAEAVSPDERGDAAHDELMRSVALEHGLIRLEAFRLMAPGDDWHHAWLAEFPTLEGAQAWQDADTRPPHSTYSAKTCYLTRKWSPEYFAAWAPR